MASTERVAFLPCYERPVYDYAQFPVALGPINTKAMTFRPKNKQKLQIERILTL
jgi:hypothetical protein